MRGHQVVELSASFGPKIDQSVFENGNKLTSRSDLNFSIVLCHISSFFLVNKRCTCDELLVFVWGGKSCLGLVSLQSNKRCWFYNTHSAHSCSWAAPVNSTQLISSATLAVGYFILFFFQDGFGFGCRRNLLTQVHLGDSDCASQSVWCTSKSEPVHRSTIHH